MGAGAFQQVRRAAERPHHAGETLGRVPASDRSLDPPPSLLCVGHEAADQQGFAAERPHDRLDPWIETRAAQHVEGMAHLDGIAGRIRKRLVHVGHERARG